LKQIGLVEGELPKIHAAQAAGCSPVVNAIRDGLEYPEPVKPDTIAKSIAIGNPADGYQVVQTVKSTGGTGAAVSDEQIVDAIRLLAETEGIFTEPAGGTTLAATLDLVKSGVIKPGESVVVCVTGNGYKTAEVVTGKLDEPVQLSRSFKDFEGWWERQQQLVNS
jgi:threonine synthase